MGTFPVRKSQQSNIVLEGSFLLERGIAAGLEVLELYCVPSREAWLQSLIEGTPGAKIPSPTLIPERRIAEIAGYPFHRGVYALARRPAAKTLVEALPSSSGPSTILVLPELGDPENLGSSFRNAAAFGCSSIILGPRGPDPLSSRVLRVSMGSSLNLPWARIEGPSDLAALEGAGFISAACVLDSSASDIRGWDRPERLALFLGNEAYGLSEAWLAKCLHRITLPMRGGTDSLNVATAAAVVLYAFS